MGKGGILHSPGFLDIGFLICPLHHFDPYIKLPRLIQFLQQNHLTQAFAGLLVLLKISDGPQERSLWIVHNFLPISPPPPVSLIFLLFSFHYGVEIMDYRIESMIILQKLQILPLSHRTDFPFRWVYSTDQLQSFKRLASTPNAYWSIFPTSIILFLRRLLWLSVKVTRYFPTLWNRYIFLIVTRDEKEKWSTMRA